MIHRCELAESPQLPLTALAIRASLRKLKLDGRTLNVPLYALESLPQVGPALEGEAEQ